MSTCQRWVFGLGACGQPLPCMAHPDAVAPIERILEQGRLYLAYDRIVCGRTGCAGMSAVTTARTIHGAPVTAFTARDAAAWEAQMGEPARCECGDVGAEGAAA